MMTNHHLMGSIARRRIATNRKLLRVYPRKSTEKPKARSTPTAKAILRHDCDPSWKGLALSSFSLGASPRSTRERTANAADSIVGKNPAWGVLKPPKLNPTDSIKRYPDRPNRMMAMIMLLLFIPVKREGGPRDGRRSV